MWNDAQVEDVLTAFLREEQSALSRVDATVQQRASAGRAGARNQSDQANSSSMTSASARLARPVATPSAANGSAGLVVLACALCLVTVILLTAGGNQSDPSSVVTRDSLQDSAVVATPAAPATAVVVTERSHVGGRTPVENQPHGRPVHMTDPDLTPGIGAGTDDDLYLQGTEIEVFGVPGTEGQFSPPNRAGNHRPAIAEPRRR